MGERFRCLTDNRCDRCVFGEASPEDRQAAAAIMGHVSVGNLKGRGWMAEVSHRVETAASRLGHSSMDGAIAVANASLLLQISNACPPPDTA